MVCLHRVKVSMLCSAILCLSGCLALSFGGKSQQVETVVAESPETKERLSRLEARMSALEQQLSPQLPPVTSSP